MLRAYHSWIVARRHRRQRLDDDGVDALDVLGAVVGMRVESRTEVVRHAAASRQPVPMQTAFALLFGGDVVGLELAEHAAEQYVVDEVRDEVRRSARRRRRIGRNRRVHKAYLLVRQRHAGVEIDVETGERCAQQPVHVVLVDRAEHGHRPATFDYARMRFVTDEIL